MRYQRRVVGMTAAALLALGAIGACEKQVREAKKLSLIHI